MHWGWLVFAMLSDIARAAFSPRAEKSSVFAQARPMAAASENRRRADCHQIIAG